MSNQINTRKRLDPGQVRNMLKNTPNVKSSITGDVVTPFPVLQTVETPVVEEQKESK